MPTQTRPLPTVPRVDDPALYEYLTQLHNVVVGLTGAAAAPNLPTNLIATPIAGGVVVQFTRSNGVTNTLYAGSSPDRATASPQPLGSSNRYTDNVGQPNVLRYYWVEALNQAGISSGVVGPVSATTLALNSPSSPLPPVRPSQVVVFDTTIDRIRPVIASVDPDVPGQTPPRK